MLAVVGDLERYGKTEMWAYLIAFGEARTVLGPQFKRPIGECSNVEFNIRLLGICFAAHYLNSESC